MSLQDSTEHCQGKEVLVAEVALLGADGIHRARGRHLLGEPPGASVGAVVVDVHGDGQMSKGRFP